MIGVLRKTSANRAGVSAKISRTLSPANSRLATSNTSRPATDKTLRGAVKPYLDHLLAQGQLAADGDAVPLTLTAALVAEGQEVPIGGTIAVQATRRGKTIVEPKPEE